MKIIRWQNKNYDREIETYRLNKNLKPSKYYSVFKETRFHNDFLDDLETAIEESSLPNERKHQMAMVLYNQFYDDTYNAEKNIKIK